MSKSKPDIATFLKSDLSKIMMSDSFAFLLPSLDSIFINDQRYRSIYDNQLYLNHKEDQNRLDPLSIIKIKEIVKQYGWLGAKQIGALRATYLLYAVQHCRNNDKEYFFPFLLDAYRKKTLPAIGIFAFIDRYLSNKHEQQLFGIEMLTFGNKELNTIGNIYPIYNSAEVESRWVHYGSITTYKSYIKSILKTEWNVQEHLKFVPELSQKLNVQIDSTANIKRMLHLLDSCLPAKN